MLKIVKNLLYFSSVTLALLTPRLAYAEKMNCNSDSGSYVLNLGNVFVENNFQPGNVIAVDSHEIQVTCKGSGNYQQLSKVSDTSWSSSGMTVSVDGITCSVIDEGTTISDAGLGIVWTNYNSNSGVWACMSSAFTGGTIRRGLKPNATTTLTDKIYIVRTNKEINYGETNELTQTVHVDEANEDRVSRGHLYSFSFSASITITSGGCTVENMVNVDMGTLSSSTFSGIGTTGPDVPFSISLQECYGVATQAHFDFTPVYDFANKERGVVALNNGPDAVTGVGIQLLMNGKEITGSNDNIYPLKTGYNTIPFIARYYQTEEMVTPGNADTTVVFNIIYD